MALTLAALVLGSHLYGFRDGSAFTVPGAGTAGRTAKPGATDPAWVDLGIVEDSDANRESEEIVINAPSPGRMREYDVIEGLDKLLLTATTKECSPLALEVLFKTAVLTGASTQFNPLAGTTKKGWIKGTFYDSDDVLRLTGDLFCHWKLTAAVPMGGGKLVECKWQFRVLHSTLNTFAIA